MQDYESGVSYLTDYAIMPRSFGFVTSSKAFWSRRFRMSNPRLKRNTTWIDVHPNPQSFRTIQELAIVIQ
jgi:hypothetical protein